MMIVITVSHRRSVFDVLVQFHTVLIGNKMSNSISYKKQFVPLEYTMVSHSGQH